VRSDTDRNRLRIREIVINSIATTIPATTSAEFTDEIRKGEGMKHPSERGHDAGDRPARSGGDYLLNENLFIIDSAWRTRSGMSTPAGFEDPRDARARRRGPGVFSPRPPDRLTPLPQRISAGAPPAATFERARGDK
jgi:hypothetical protein